MILVPEKGRKGKRKSGDKEDNEGRKENSNSYDTQRE